MWAAGNLTNPDQWPQPADQGRYAAKAAMRLSNRHPMLYVATLAVALLCHFALCYPAAVSRGYPAIDPFWEYIAIYLVFLAPAFAPVFEDFSDSPKIRKAILVLFAIVAAVIVAVPLANMAGARPRIGHLAGYLGVWRYDWVVILVKAVFGSVVAVPFVVCLESIARSVWDKLRTLSETSAA